MLRFHLVSLFPEFFRSPLETALLGRAREAGIVDFSFHDPRSFSTSRHHHVDDRPYGGGPGTRGRGAALHREAGTHDPAGSQRTSPQ